MDLAREPILLHLCVTTPRHSAMTDSAQAPATDTTRVTCPFHGGMESHTGPYGDERGVIVRRTSDAMFGPEGLGFGRTPWMTLVSWLARQGISEQTGSRPNETIVSNCVLGWGQGAYSSHVFQAGGAIDQVRVEQVIRHLQEIAGKIEGDSRHITSAVAAAYIGAQRPQPYLTVTGVREVTGLRERLSSRFRGHIQWQSLVALCGHVTTDGTKVLTPGLLRMFFASEGSFFVQLVDRRRSLASGALTPGAAVGLLAQVDAGVDRAQTDRAYMHTKSALWVILRILYYMATRKGAGLRPL